MGLEISEGSRYRRAKKTECSEYCGARDNREFEIPWGRKPSVWSTVELEITEGTRYRRVKKTECSEYYGARDNRWFEKPRSPRYGGIRVTGDSKSSFFFGPSFTFCNY